MYMCVRKVPMPGYPELAMGAVAPMGERFTNRRVASLLSREQLDEAYDTATAEARAMDERLRGSLPMMLIGRTAVLVDDGAATGASIRAAMAAIRNAGARQIVIALPVLPRPQAERLRARMRAADHPASAAAVYRGRASSTRTSAKSPRTRSRPSSPPPSQRSNCTPNQGE